MPFDRHLSKVTLSDLFFELDYTSALGLGVLERLVLLSLPMLVDDYGCTGLDLRLLRHRICPDCGVSIGRLKNAISKLAGRNLVRLHNTNCKMTVLYAKYLEGLLPCSTRLKPTFPLPDNIDWVEQENGTIKITRYC